MTDKQLSSRRRYLKLAGSASIVSLAGCMGNNASNSGGQQTTTTDTSSNNQSNNSSGQAISMGSIIPITGSLSAYGSGMQKAVNLAAKNINDAGGPLGRNINVVNKDSQTQPSKAIQKYSSLVNENNIVGFVGAASSGVSVPIAQRVAKDKVMQVSHASTTPALAEIGFGQDGQKPKYFGRTAPNDAQQGIVMGRILSDKKYIGADKAAFLYVDNPYGEGLAQKAKKAFKGQTTNMVAYSKKATDYSSTLDKLFQGNPDGVGFVGYPGNGKTILKQWAEGGYGGNWVLSEGLNSKKFLTNNRNITANMYLASPSPESTKGAKEFEKMMGEKNTLFAPHAYDALFLQALAIQKAGEASGTAIAKNIRDVSRPDSDADVTVSVGQFKKAKQALKNGKTINYAGASSPVNLNKALEPINRFAILRVPEQGKATKTLEEIPRSYFEGKL
ncbi:ABC transporter substrate-binding protein [Halomicrococcus sp. NG-SE-24]|uniref:ABC transporter substrate-binding protein n=1 Tax=Halomicrococcus sp. NG-SE-24 TaxID=3436928 RepID=UPI003D9691B0